MHPTSCTITMLLINLCVFFALRVLFPHAPDRIQKGVIFVLGLAFGMFAIVEAAVLFGYALPWWVGAYVDDLRRTASVIEHLAVVLYVFRLFIADQERRCLPKSSLPSRNSPA